MANIYIQLHLINTIDASNTISKICGLDTYPIFDKNHIIMDLKFKIIDVAVLE